MLSDRTNKMIITDPRMILLEYAEPLYGVWWELELFWCKMSNTSPMFLCDQLLHKQFLQWLADKDMNDALELMAVVNARFTGSVFPWLAQHGYPVESHNSSISRNASWTPQDLDIVAPYAHAEQLASFMSKEFIKKDSSSYVNSMQGIGGVWSIQRSQRMGRPNGVNLKIDIIGVQSSEYMDVRRQMLMIVDPGRRDKVSPPVETDTSLEEDIGEEGIDYINVSDGEVAYAKEKNDKREENQAEESDEGNNTVSPDQRDNIETSDINYDEPIEETFKDIPEDVPLKLPGYLKLFETDENINERLHKRKSQRSTSDVETESSPTGDKNKRVKLNIPSQPVHNEQNQKCGLEGNDIHQWIERSFDFKFLFCSADKNGIKVTDRFALAYFTSQYLQKTESVSGEITKRTPIVKKILPIIQSERDMSLWNRCLKYNSYGAKIHGFTLTNPLTSLVIQLPRMTDVTFLNVGKSKADIYQTASCLVGSLTTYDPGQSFQFKIEKWNDSLIRSFTMSLGRFPSINVKFMSKLQTEKNKSCEMLIRKGPSVTTAYILKY